MKDELNDFIDELEELLENPKYLFAHETLSGIKTTVQKSQTITAGQRRAVRNIKGVPDEEDNPSLPSQRLRPRDKKGYIGDLLLGTLLQPGSLRPNRIYEIREIMDTYVIEDIGPSAIRLENSRGIDCAWSWSVNDILNEARGRFVLTVEEATRK